MKLSIKDFFSKCEQIRRKLWIWSHEEEEILNRKLHVYALVFAQVYVLFTACLRLAIVGTFGNRFNLTHVSWSIFFMFSMPWPVCKWNYADHMLSYFLIYFCVDNQKGKVSSKLMTNTPEKGRKIIGKLAKTHDFSLVSLFFYFEQFRNIMLRSLVLPYAF